MAAETRRRAVLRAVLRDLASVGAEPAGSEEHLEMAQRSGYAKRDVPAARAQPHAAHDVPVALPGGVRLRVAVELVHRVDCGGCAKVPGAIGALGTTSSSVISFVSPPANVMRIAVSSSDE